MKGGIDLRKNNAVKANKTIQDTRMEMTPEQFNLLTCLIGKIKPQDSPETLYEITVEEFCAATGKSLDGYYYTAIKKDLQALSDKSTYILTDNGNEILFRWLDEVIIDHGNGRIQIGFHRHARKFLFALAKNFTSYPVGHLLALKSMAAKRLYEILCSYKYLKKTTISLEELKRELNAVGYAAFYDFRRYVLDKAVAEINEYTDLSVTYAGKSGKGSKKIERIEFCIDEVDLLERDVREQNRKIAFEYNHDRKRFEDELWGKHLCQK